MARLRTYRLGRVREQLAEFDCGAALLFNPINIRYATGSRSHHVFAMHIPTRYVFVPVEGPVILFDGEDYRPIARGLESIDELRPMRIINFFFGGTRVPDNAKLLADEIADLMHQHGGNKRLAVDRADPRIVAALDGHGVEVADGEEPLERARAIKSAEEILCLNYAIAVAEVGMARMREALEPGMSENELWSILHQTNIAHGGEWVDARLMAAGDRANPWSQEASDRIIRPAELVAFDTDMVGPFGYCADISRTLFVGPGKPTPKQRDLYKLAHEEIHHNMALMKPGMSFHEFSEKAWALPEDCVPNRYVVVTHGIGMCDEYPAVYYTHDWAEKGFDGYFEENMTVCIESYIGPVGYHEGVKLEQQCLLTANGLVALSRFPWEDELLA